MPIEQDGIQDKRPTSSQKSPPGPDAPMGELFTHLFQETRHYVEAQAQLAKMQALQALAGGLYDAAKIAVALTLLSLAGLCLVIALALGLSVWLGSYWLGTLVTGVLLLVVGAIALRVALGTSFVLTMIPTDLIRQVRAIAKGASK